MDRVLSGLSWMNANPETGELVKWLSTEETVLDWGILVRQTTKVIKERELGATESKTQIRRCWEIFWSSGIFNTITERELFMNCERAE